MKDSGENGGKKELLLLDKAIESGDRYLLNCFIAFQFINKMIAVLALILCFLIAREIELDGHDKYGFFGVSMVAAGGALIGKKNG